MAILTGVRWRLVVLTCIALILGSIEHLFISPPHPPAILYVFFGELSVWTFCPSFGWVVYFLDIELSELFVNSEINPLLEILRNTFLHGIKEDTHLIVVYDPFNVLLRVFASMFISDTGL